MALAAKVVETLAVTGYEFVVSNRGIAGRGWKPGLTVPPLDGGRTERLEGLPVMVVDPGPDG